MPAVQRLEQRDAERELIRLGVARPAALLRRHVPGRADGGAGAGERRVEGRRRRLVGDRLGRGLGAGARDAEVGDAHAALAVDQHVRRLEVAMDEPGVVGGQEPATGLDERVEDLLRRSRSLLEPRPQGRARDQLHREDDVLPDHHHVEDVHDVGMRQAGHRLGLAPQPDVARLALRHRVQELDRDPSVELGIVRRIHRAHASLTQRVEDHVAAHAGAAREHVLERDHPGGRPRLAGGARLAALAQGDRRDRIAQGRPGVAVRLVRRIVLVRAAHQGSCRSGHSIVRHRRPGAGSSSTRAMTGCDRCDAARGSRSHDADGALVRRGDPRIHGGDESNVLRPRSPSRSRRRVR